MNTGDDLPEVEVVLFQGDAFGTVEDYAIDTFGQLIRKNTPSLDLT